MRFGIRRARAGAKKYGSSTKIGTSSPAFAAACSGAWSVTLRSFPRNQTSVRTGSIPGTHEFIFDAPFETIRLAHVARDRRVFAEGALVAAAWLIGRRGVFTMKDVLATSAE